MALEFVEEMKALGEYIEVLKHELLFSMAERKRKPEKTNTHKIISIKQELDKAAQEKMRLNQINYGNTSKSIALTSPIAQYRQRIS